MRSDMKALLMIFAWSTVLAVVLMGILATVAFGWVNRETAGVVALVLFVAGLVFMLQRYGPALSSREPPADRPETDRPRETDRSV